MVGHTIVFETITPEKAQDYIAKNFLRNRNRSPKYVAHLAHLMESGQFLGKITPPLVFCILNNTEILIDGQHRLAAVVKSGAVLPLKVERIPVKNEEELASFFGKFDIPRRRTLGDTIGGAAFDTEIGTSKRNLGRAATAIRVIKSGFPSNHILKRYSDAEIMELIRGWKDQILPLVATLEGTNSVIRQRLEISPVLSVFLVILRYEPEEGIKFLDAVVSPNGLSTGDPPLELAFWLRETKYKDNFNKGAGPGDLSRSVAKAWHAYRSGKKLKHITKKNIGDITLPIKIDGSPFNGLSSTDVL